MFYGRFVQFFAYMAVFVIHLSHVLHKWLCFVVHLEQIWFQRGALGAVLARAHAGLTRSAGARVVLEASAVLAARACWGQRLLALACAGPRTLCGLPRNFQLARAGIQLGSFPLKIKYRHVGKRCPLGAL